MRASRVSFPAPDRNTSPEKRDSPMNEKQRIKHYIHFESVETIPWQINYTSDIGHRLMQEFDLPVEHHEVLGKNIFAFNALEKFLGNHIVPYLRTRAVNSVKEVKPGIWQDEWGVLWDRTIDKDIGTPMNCLLEEMQFADLTLPDPDDPDRYAHLTPIIEANSDRYLLARRTYCLFERAWSLRGMENLLMDFVLHPSFVHQLFELITEFNLKVVKNLINFPIDGIYFGDDWGSQGGLLISPATWREFIKPYMKRLYAQAHQQGYDVFIHSCGNNSLIMEDLIEIGVNVFNPFQPEVIDVEQMMQQYAQRLAFYGSLSIQRTLPFGTPADVRQEVKHRLRLARQYGGLIISPAHDMPPDIPTDNVLAMLDVLQSQS
ncbi:hypothetical protein GF339_07555 [candidate division KSB3 bacterium]|uniref:Uroporphyrinogen decarboxylase (URO-D) domain-containing protein n=1 Tax=candidate division KSB3 bacterium TaxID=2044937 RepID=A0A9D5JUU0_9BACT|nr:hypothetical protein [candidate division KSB3 bacterium]MBD3324426.1 hypothetical protein [candidate division KSB3 bacterium]